MTYTNKVYLVESSNQKIVVKIWDDFTREAEFFWYIADLTKDPNIIFPRLLDTRWDDILIIEYKEGINWKEIVDDIDKDNRYHIWIQLGKNLKTLHNISLVWEIDRNIEIEKMINYLSTNTKIFDQTLYNKELEKFRYELYNTNEKFVLLHWDFSPHNCLFTRNKEKNTINISAILDPSGRVWWWIRYFDISYLMNTRRNKNKAQLARWFNETYKDIDKNNPMYIATENIMKMYLAEIYNDMWDKESSKNILDSIHQ